MCIEIKRNGCYAQTSRTSGPSFIVTKYNRIKRFQAYTIQKSNLGHYNPSLKYNILGLTAIKNLLKATPLARVTFVAWRLKC